MIIMIKIEIYNIITTIYIGIVNQKIHFSKTLNVGFIPILLPQYISGWIRFSLYLGFISILLPQYIVGWTMQGSTRLERQIMKCSGQVTRSVRKERNISWIWLTPSYILGKAFQIAA